MSRRRPGRRALATVTVWAAVLLGVPLAAAAPPPGTTVGDHPIEPAAASPAVTSQGRGPRVVSYEGVTVEVPTGWAVVDLEKDPSACVRLDVDAVYLGTPGQEQRCPARAVGRGSTIQIAPDASARARGVPPDAPMVGDDRTRTLKVPEHGVRVTGTWGPEGSHEVDAVLDRLAEGAVATLPQAEPSPAALSALPMAMLAATQPSGTPLHGGMAFDTCRAPTVAQMQAWRSSPYAAVGIYTSGSMRACPFQATQGAAWIQQVIAQGWGLMPIHVGLQAPCTQSTKTDRYSTDPGTARAQGVSAADEAATANQALGLAQGSTIYLDIEGYSNTDAACSAASIAFVSGWTAQIRSRGYASGVYGGLGSMMRDMSQSILTGNASFVAPDHVWIARWNGLQTTRDTGSPQYLPDSYWANHQRLHQYQGDHDETWGGVPINIDSNWVDATLAGQATQADYGTNTLGPGSAGFVFTGDMAYWRTQPGSGALQRAYSTGPSSTSTEYNGATWSPVLAPGIYRAEVNVPSTTYATAARYTLSGASGTTTTVLDQSAGSGYRPVGSALVQPGSPVTLHLGDNGGGDTSRRIWADAARFVQTGFLPGAPGGVTATASEGRAVVSWTAAAPNGAALTEYVVTAAPGGATVTVPATSLSATVGGLANGTAYTFTVKAVNVVGTGPASAASIPVTPGLPGGFATVDPVRLVDTRQGTPANPGVTSIVPANGQVRFRVAGAGTSVPDSAAAVVANVTVVAGSAPGVFWVVGTGGSLINWRPGDVIANLTTLPVSADGTVTLQNTSAAPAHLVVDLQGWTSTEETDRISAIASTRVLDSRSGTATNVRATALAPWETLEIRVTGGAVPSTAEAALLRVTATEPGSAGYVTVSPSTSMSTSVVNFVNGQTVGNAIMARLTPAGTVTVPNRSGTPTHVVVDVQGWIGASAAELYRPTPQARLVDSRTGTGANPLAAALAPGEVRNVKVAGASGSPVPAGSRTAMVNLTVTEGAAVGWVAVGADANPSIPLVNHLPGESRAGLGLVDVAADGTVRIRNNSYGRVHVILDVHGYGTSP